MIALQVALVVIQLATVAALSRAAWTFQRAVRRLEARPTLPRHLWQEKTLMAPMTSTKNEKEPSHAA